MQPGRRLMQLGAFKGPGRVGSVPTGDPLINQGRRGRPFRVRTVDSWERSNKPRQGSYQLDSHVKLGEVLDEGGLGPSGGPIAGGEEVKVSRANFMVVLAA